jgi:hypothetical protein
VLDCDEDEDPMLVLLDAAKEEFFFSPERLGGPKTKGKREVLNLESFINYGDAKASVRQGKGKAHMW